MKKEKKRKIIEALASIMTEAMNAKEIIRQEWEETPCRKAASLKALQKDMATGKIANGRFSFVGDVPIRGKLEGEIRHLLECGKLKMHPVEGEGGSAENIFYAFDEDGYTYKFSMWEDLGDYVSVRVSGQEEDGNFLLDCNMATNRHRVNAVIRRDHCYIDKQSFLIGARRFFLKKAMLYNDISNHFFLAHIKHLGKETAKK